MIRIARVWYNVVACYHNERALDHARRRDKALRKLERRERAHMLRESRREIDKILARKGAPFPDPLAPGRFVRHVDGRGLVAVARLDDTH